MDPLLFLVGLAAFAAIPLALDNWFHDRDRFKLRKAAYATGWQKWIMENRNAGRYTALFAFYLMLVVVIIQPSSLYSSETFILCMATAIAAGAFGIFQLSHLF